MGRLMTLIDPAYVEPTEEEWRRFGAEAPEFARGRKRWGGAAGGPVDLGLVRRVDVAAVDDGEREAEGFSYG
jgi:hypothetical protein